MTWFKVDDKLHSNSKIRKVLAEEPAALALWTVAGSWSSDNLEDGFVPDHQLPWLLPTGADELAQKLVAARLWKRVRGGYQFHEWDADGDGTRRNPTRAEVEAERRKKAEAGRRGGLASGKARSRTEARASAPALARASPRASQVVEPPTRPDPKGRGGTGGLKGGNSVTRASPEPPPRCAQHTDDPDPPPCGRCADLRRDRQQWDRDQATAAAAARQADARTKAEANRLAVDACRMCDQHGYIGPLPCSHDPDQAERTRTRAAEARAALARTAGGAP